MAPEYRPFFGTESEVSARVELDDTGATRLEDCASPPPRLLLDGRRVPRRAKPPGPDRRDRADHPPGRAGASCCRSRARIRRSGRRPRDRLRCGGGRGVFVVDATLDDLAAADLSVATARIERRWQDHPVRHRGRARLAEVDVRTSGWIPYRPRTGRGAGDRRSAWSRRLDWSRPARCGSRIASVGGRHVALSGAVAADLNDGALPARLRPIARSSPISPASPPSAVRPVRRARGEAFRHGRGALGRLRHPAVRHRPGPARGARRSRSPAGRRNTQLELEAVPRHRRGADRDPDA
jgi:hypothetical protein